LILVTREGFLKDKCGPRAKKFEHHCFRLNCDTQLKQNETSAERQ